MAVQGRHSVAGRGSGRGQRVGPYRAVTQWPGAGGGSVCVLQAVGPNGFSNRLKKN